MQFRHDNDGMLPAERERVGLCLACEHAQVVTSSKGSTFYLCRLSEVDPRFRRYPVLPVTACPGYSPDWVRKNG
jgi:hypothetical protein